ncbi:MAG: hypothetical protein ACOY3Y_19005 [Acidobacteriota bacterium]
MATPPPMPPQPPMTSAPAPRKKTSPWVWVLAGCGGLLVIVILALAVGGFFFAKKVKTFAEGAEKNPAVAAAKVIALVNPDIEIVSSDDGKGTVTLRNKKTGEEITVDAEDIKKGRLKFRNEKGEEVTFESSGEGEGQGFKVESDKGTMTFGAGSSADLPEWLPSYPGSAAEGTYAATTDEGSAGGVTFKTSDSAERVLSHFREALENAGFEVKDSSFSQGGKLAMGMLNASADGERRKVTVTVTPGEGETAALVAWEERKE